MLPENLKRALHARMTELAESQRIRKPPTVQFSGGSTYRIKDQQLRSFCSNDYLGFASEPLTVSAPQSGAGASRLVHGDHVQLREVEAQFAARLGFEDAILCQSGYLANLLTLSQLPRLPGQEETVFWSDALNHRSIIDGLALGNAAKQILSHLQPPPNSPGQWWICESRYSMTGDEPSLKDLRTHLEDQGYLYLDEAHRFGLEPGGQGLAAQLPHKPTICSAPLGKSFGLQGAMLLGPKLLLDWLRQEARGYIYTTAPSPLLTQAILDRCDAFFGSPGEQRRQRLAHNLRVAEAMLERPITSPITPLPMPDNAAALRASEALAKRGFHVQAIRPPTVPEAILRITWSAKHSEQDIAQLASALRAEGLL